MIAAVRGEVLEIGLDHAVVEVGGAGLAVHATPATLARLRRGEQARLATSLVVREDSLTLFGFADAEERDLFTLLQTVSGVGPRLALATLAVLDPDALRRALADGDATALTRVPGIGRKGAERMVLELRDKVVAPRPGPERPRHGGRAARPGRRGPARARLPGRSPRSRRWTPCSRRTAPSGRAAAALAAWAAPDDAGLGAAERRAGAAGRGRGGAP